MTSRYFEQSVVMSAPGADSLDGLKLLVDMMNYEFGQALALQTLQVHKVWGSASVGKSKHLGEAYTINSACQSLPQILVLETESTNLNNCYLIVYLQISSHVNWDFHFNDKREFQLI